MSIFFKAREMNCLEANLWAKDKTTSVDWTYTRQASKRTISLPLQYNRSFLFFTAEEKIHDHMSEHTLSISDFHLLNWSMHLVLLHEMCYTLIYVGNCMEIKIPQHILEETTRCTRKFSCLSDTTRDFCKIVHANGLNVLFINQNPRACSYKIPFGSSYICTCPTRFEIYKNHNIWCLVFRRLRSFLKGRAGIRILSLPCCRGSCLNPGRKTKTFSPVVRSRSHIDIP